MSMHKPPDSVRTIYNWMDKTILLIDNDPVNCMLISLFLKSTSCQLIFKDNPQEGLSHINNQTTDLVLTELYFKKMEGINLIQLIRKIDKSVPIIVQTFLTFDFDREKEAYLTAGCNQFFTKPIDFIKLMQIIDVYLKSSVHN